MIVKNMDIKDLIGKTIVDVFKMKYRNYDDEGYLQIVFSDNTKVLISAGYNEYTGNSLDEYPTKIEINGKWTENKYIKIEE